VKKIEGEKGRKRIKNMPDLGKGPGWKKKIFSRN